MIPIVFTGGVILSLSLLALRASSLGFFRELAPALAVTVAVAMLVSLVFVPALIALLGRFAVWPTRPEQDGDDVAARRPIGQRIAHLAAGRPLAALIGLACVALLGRCRPAGPHAAPGRGRDLGAPQPTAGRRWPLAPLRPASRPAPWPRSR